MDWVQFLRDAALGNASYHSFRASKGIESLNNAFEEYQKRSESQLARISSDVKRGFLTMCMELAIQSETFKNIETVLKNKRKAEAEELKEFGIKALRNDWIEDAIEDFDKSIEINRYDYQVYYLLAKCYYLLGDKGRQEKNIELAYHYSIEDKPFRMYIALDIVASLVNEKNYPEARRVLEIAEQDADNENVDHSPLNLARIYIDIFSQSVNEETMDAISRSLENYQGEDPGKIITTILALSQQCDQQTQIKIQNLFNLKKLSLTKYYWGKVLTYLNNISKFLNINTLAINNTAPYAWVPEAVREKFFPYGSSINELRQRLNKIIASPPSPVIDKFEEYIFLTSSLSELERTIISDYIDFLREKEDRVKYFTRRFGDPVLKIDVGQKDRILYQVELEEPKGAFITLTYFKIIIIDENRRVYTYDIIDDSYRSFNDKITQNFLGTSQTLKRLIYYIRDKISDRVYFVAGERMRLKVDNEGAVPTERELFDWADSLITIYKKMMLTDIDFQALKLYLDFLDSGDRIISKAEPDNNSEVDAIEFLDNTEEVEFLD